jgi:plastocyanin
MRSLRFLGILVISCLLVVVLPPQISHASLASYLPGVKVGDWMNYGDVQTSCEAPCHYSFDGFKATTFTVSSISGSNVTMNQVSSLPGNPAPTKSVALENIDTGQGNLSQWFLVAGGLGAASPIFNGASYPTINSTESGVYVGDLRQANVLNLTIDFPNATVLNQVYRWDSLAGVLLDFYENSTSPSLAFSLSYRLTGTNLWKYHVSIIDDGSCNTVSSTCRFSPTSAPVIAGTTIEWDNTGQLSHTITACSTVNNGLFSGGCGVMDNTTLPSFDSGPIAAGANYSLTFNVPGIYYYFSRVYPWMDATVSVLGNATNTPISPPDFSLTAVPSTFIFPINGTWYHPPGFLITSLNDFAGPVTLTSHVNPPGLEITLNTASPISGPTANLTLVPKGQNSTSVLPIVLQSTPSGTYTVTVIATSGTITHSANLTIILPVVGPDFEMSASPSYFTITQYSTAASNITLTSLKNFTGNITLSAEFTAQGGPFTVTVQPHLSSTNVDVSANSTATLEMTIGPLCQVNSFCIPSGYYLIIVTASSGLITHKILIPLFVVPLNVTITSVGPKPVDTGQTITVDFSIGSTATISDIAVDWGDGTITHPSLTATSDTHVYLTTEYDEPQTSFTINVTATNANGVGFATASEVVNDRPPTVTIISLTPKSTTTGATVTLLFSASDPDGTVQLITVGWGDGTISTLAGRATSSTHVYTSAGSFTVSVNATDNAGSTSQPSTSTITVAQVASPAAPASAILGLAPFIFYGIIVAIIVAAAGVVTLALAFRKRTRERFS